MPYNIRQQGAFFSTGDPETVSDKTMYAPGLLGARATVKEPSTGSPVVGGTTAVSRVKTYQYVQSDSGMAVAPFKGAVAWWSDKSKYLATTSQSKLGRGRIAGVFENDESGLIDGKGANPIIPGNFCWIQTAGPALVKFIDAPTSAPDATGKFVIPSSTDGKADCIAAGTASTFPTLGVSAGATTLFPGNTLALVDLDVPETV
jgi:hypothetical protein